MMKNITINPNELRRKKISVDYQQLRNGSENKSQSEGKRRNRKRSIELGFYNKENFSINRFNNFDRKRQKPNFKMQLNKFDSKNLLTNTQKNYMNLMRKFKPVQIDKKQDKKGEKILKDSTLPLFCGEIDNSNLIFKSAQKICEDILWLLPKNKISVNKKDTYRYICQKGQIKFSIDLFKIKNTNDAVYLNVNCLVENFSNEFMNLKKKVVNIIGK